MTPKVSIILPTFNRLQYLRTAVDSVFAQTLQEWELIIADDGSDGETAGYLAELAESPRVQVLSLVHSGNPAAVRNAALRVARGEYVAFLDSDDAWLPAKLEVQLAAHASCDARRWSYTALARIDDGGKPMRDGLGLSWVPYEGAIFEQLLTLAAAVATPSVIVDRRFLEEIGGFDEGQQFFEDYDLWLRLSLLSDVTVINEPLVLVRNHREHYSADRIRVYESRFKLLDKMSRHAKTPRLRAVLKWEREKNAASLALVSAIAGRRIGALTMLWRSRGCVWHQRGWWHKSCTTLAYALAPLWLREAVRRHRRGRLARAAGTPDPGRPADMHVE
jgi:glycosyltransferase involved in cell wall biosynthesis